MAVEDALGGSRHMLVSHRHRTRSGAYIWCDTAGFTDGRFFYLVCRDVRNRKEAEAALRAFTLSTSHDLREPCNSILVCVAMLERRLCVTRDADASFLAVAARSSCGLLLGIVANVLTARQVEANELQLDSRLFSPTDVLRDVLQACRCAAAEGAITWDRSPGDLLPHLVDADSHRISQVVQNLVTNAVRVCFACCVDAAAPALSVRASHVASGEIRAGQRDAARVHGGVGGARARGCRRCGQAVAHHPRQRHRARHERRRGALLLQCVQPHCGCIGRRCVFDECLRHTRCSHAAVLTAAFGLQGPD
jgi:hypothetical protein